MLPRHFTAAERRARQQLRPDVSASRSRACSEASSGASPSTSAATSAAQAGRREIPQSPLAAKLFENVRPLEEAAASSSGSSGAAEASTAASTTADRVLSAVGNSIFFGLLGTGSFFGYYTLKYDADQIQTMVDETKKAENAFPGSQAWVTVMEWYVDKRRQLESEVKKYSDPPSEHLLPDLPPEHRHVKTLVLDLDDTLIHSDWTRERGWRTFKRPGAEDFLRNMAQYYEMVVYTDQLPTYADPILDRLDPNRYIQWRLYKDSTQYVNGKHVRDIAKLNREPGKVLLLSANPDAFYLHPENAIKLKPWRLETDDTKLLDLMPFLEAVVRMNVADVRAVVKSYEGEDIPTAFKERMKRLADTQKTKQRGFLGSASAR